MYIFEMHSHVTTEFNEKKLVVDALNQAILDRV